MNAFLKSFLKEVVDLVAAGEAVLSQAGLAKILPLLVQVGEDAPAVVVSLNDAIPELKALLADPAADADLLAYAATLVVGDSEKAKKVILASADLALALAEKSAALYEAVKS